MKLYLLKQDKIGGRDTFDSCVVCAVDEEDAKTIHPASREDNAKDGKFEDDGYPLWCIETKDVSAIYLGEASEDIKRGVICSSFNSG